MEASEHTPKTGNLVLKTRVAVLTRNLKEVQRALDSVQERRRDLRKLLEVPARLEDSLETINRHLDGAKQAVDAGSLEDSRFPLQRIEDQVAGLDELIADVAESISRIRSSPPSDDGVAKYVRELLYVAIQERFGGLESLQTDIEQAGNQMLEGQDDAARASAQKAWARYADELYENSEKLFAEYVELVGGLAIRDTGFDQGICRIADELIRPFRSSGEHTWNSLTIPARREALSLTDSRIIRLGFPEWTIWTLPLAAHEFGHVFANWDNTLQNYVSDGHVHQVCLADAFATFVMGPAYACAAILMRLNAAAAFSEADERLTAKRVAVIIAVLQKMSRMTGRVEDLYGPITQRLASEWEDALSQTSSTGSLTDEENASVEAAVEFLDPFVYSRTLDAAAWPTIEVSAKQLRAGDIDSIDLGEYTELRYVLNAAWRARIAVVEGEHDVDDPNAISKIAEVALKLWDRIEGRDKEEGSQSGPARRSQQREPRIQTAPSVRAGPERS